MTKDEWIREQYNSATEKNIALFTSALNTQSLVANPIPRATVPKRIDIKQAFDIVPVAESFTISETRTYGRLLDAFQQGRMDWVQDNIKTLVAGGKMTLLTAQSLGVLMAQTELDPNWQPQVMASPAELAGYELIYRSEVEEALP